MGSMQGVGDAAASRIVPSVHNFSAKAPDRIVNFQITLLDGSAFIWIGSSVNGLEDLQVSIPTKYDQTLPSVATLRGDSEGPGASLAAKLSKKFKMLVFMSFNIADAESDLMLFVQKEVNTYLTNLLAAGSTDVSKAGAANSVESSAGKGGYAQA